MTIDEQRIFVVEKLLGWTHESAGKDSFNVPYPQFWRKEHETFTSLPPLTLDWLHVCEMQLMRLGIKGHEYILHLWEITGLQKNNGFLLPLPNDVPEINLMIEKIWQLWVSASKEQRLAALVETLKGSI